MPYKLFDIIDSIRQSSLKGPALLGRKHLKGTAGSVQTEELKIT